MSLHNFSSGHIQLIFGPMFSGKTSELFRRIRRLSYAKKSCIVIKYANDNRYAENEASTHDKVLMNAISATNLYSVMDQVCDYDVIGIDECQFFADLVEFAEEMANRGKIVVAAGLDATFQRNSFGRILELIPLAELVTKLSSVCMMCQQEASFSKRIGTETDIELIGGSDKYLAVCRSCYFADGYPHQDSLTTKQLNSHVTKNIPEFIDLLKRDTENLNDSICSESSTEL